MAKSSKKLVSVLIIVVGLAVVLGLKSVIFDGSLRMDPVEARSKGNREAPVKVIEHIDFQCPACAYGAKLLKEFMQKNPETVHLQLHHFPLAMHKHAITASIFAECSARQKKFWEFHDLLIENQDQWKSMDDARPAFHSFAQQSGLNLKALDKCIVDPSIEEFIFKERSRGSERGVKSTPTYFINGEIIVGATNLLKKLSQFSKKPSS